MNANKKLILENGVVILAEAFGKATQKINGELVFTTAMTGYEETLTDPSYTDQIITFAYPLQGNYGVNIYDEESNKIHAKAMIINDLTENYEHYLGTKSLNDYLLENNILGLKGVDTRAVVKMLRQEGALRCAITDLTEDNEKTIQALKQVKFTNHIAKVATNQAYHIPGIGKRVVLLDFGYKRNILKELIKRNLEIYVMPYTTSLQEIIKVNPTGILLSNGPGDPQEYVPSIELIKSLIGKFPIFGICLGHQLYGLALGGTTFKMKYGHRGINQPVRNEVTKKVYITSQNHGYCLNKTTITDNLTNIQVLYSAVNDQTIEGLLNTKTLDFTVQFHPEAHPGPNDTNFLFDEFVKILKGGEHE
ncbi:MAG: glutamine-hydrolyzing carbamoyl-phosphate synthase small subunit [Mycoplasmatales bacterium]